jgi:hypothetical protein
LGLRVKGSHVPVEALELPLATGRLGGGDSGIRVLRDTTSPAVRISVPLHPAPSEYGSGAGTRGPERAWGTYSDGAARPSYMSPRPSNRRPGVALGAAKPHAPTTLSYGRSEIPRLSDDCVGRLYQNTSDCGIFRCNRRRRRRRRLPPATRRNMSIPGQFQAFRTPEVKSGRDSRILHSATLRDNPRVFNQSSFTLQLCKPTRACSTSLRSLCNSASQPARVQPVFPHRDPSRPPLP